LEHPFGESACRVEKRNPTYDKTDEITPTYCRTLRALREIPDLVDLPEQPRRSAQHTYLSFVGRLALFKPPS